jgi:hypothetical protein
MSALIHHVSLVLILILPLPMQADEQPTPIETYPAPPLDNGTVISVPPPDLSPTDPYDQNNLGWMYQRGKGGLPQDYAEAVQWFHLSAMQGNPYGQANLGAMYESGRGVPYDPVEAVKWYRRAAAQGSGYAQTALERLSNRLGK